MTIAQVSEKYDITPDTLRYYERVGMIPPVGRTPGGLRSYTAEDCGWVELAKCMRSAGLPVEVMVEYVKLHQQGDATIPARRDLLVEQHKRLLEQKAAMEATLARLEYKISRYEAALQTGRLTWEPSEG